MEIHFAETPLEIKNKEEFELKKRDFSIFRK